MNGKFCSSLVEPRPEPEEVRTRDVSAAIPVSDDAAVAIQALVVDAEARTRQLLGLHLGLAGFEVTEIADGAQALAIGRTARFDVIVLDMTLPGIDGITACQALRDQGPNVDSPILMLTATDSESDTVLALDSGADDCLMKPFGIRELVARVHAVLRRHTRTTRAALRRTGVLHRRGVLVDVDRRITVANGQPVDLTKQEFELLHILLARPGVVFSREALLAKVWGGGTYVTKRTVDTVIGRLRSKLEPDPHAPQLILTVWGVGYKCADVG